MGRSMTPDQHYEAAKFAQTRIIESPHGYCGMNGWEYFKAYHITEYSNATLSTLAAIYGIKATGNRERIVAALDRYFAGVTWREPGGIMAGFGDVGALPVAAIVGGLSTARSLICTPRGKQLLKWACPKKGEVSMFAKMARNMVGGVASGGLLPVICTMSGQRGVEATLETVCKPDSETARALTDAAAKVVGLPADPEADTGRKGKRRAGVAGIMDVLNWPANPDGDPRGGTPEAYWKALDRLRVLHGTGRKMPAGAVGLAGADDTREVKALKEAVKGILKAEFPTMIGSHPARRVFRVGGDTPVVATVEATTGFVNRNMPATAVYVTFADGESLRYGPSKAGRYGWRQA